MNNKLNETINNIIDLTIDNASRLEDVYDLLIRIAIKTGVPVSEDHLQFINTPRESRSASISLGASPIKNKMICDPQPSIEHQPIFKYAREVPKSAWDPFFNDWTEINIPGDGNCILQFVRLAAKLLNLECPSISNLRHFCHETMQEMMKNKHLLNDNELAIFEGDQAPEAVLESKAWEQVKYLDHLLIHIKSAFECNFLIYIDYEFDSNRSAYYIGFNPSLPCVFAHWTPPSQNQKAH